MTGEFILCDKYKSCGVEFDINQEESISDRLDLLIGQHDPDKRAIINTATEKTYTFGGLLKVVSATASGLYHHGLRQGDFVSIMAPNCEQHCIFVLACLKVGAKIASVNAMCTVDDLIRDIKLTKSTGVLVTSQIAAAAKGRFPDSLKFVVTVDEDPESIPFSDLETYTDPVPPREKIDPVKETAWVLFSSGTTGPPKAVELTHDNIAMQMEILKFMDFGDVTLIYQPLSHIYGVACLLLCMESSSTFAIMPRFTPTQYMECVAKFKITAVMLVPPVATLIAKSNFEKEYDVSSVNTMVSAAAPLSGAIKQQILNKWGHHIYFFQAYGMTETCGMAIGGPPQKYKDDLYRPENEDATVGIVAPGCNIKVVDVESGKAVGPHQRGEICFRSRMNFKCYLNNPEATSSTIRDGWVHSGDIGYYDNNECFYIVDRLKELIKFNALQVSPSELETYLHEHPDIADCAVIGLPDEEHGELPFGLVVLKPGATTSPTEIQEFIAGKVAPYKKLRGGVRITNTIPKSPSGKILRRIIVEQEVAERRKGN